MTLEEVIKKIERNREAIKAFGVKKLGVFGSVVRGEATDESDIDFLVQLDNETFRIYMGLCFLLEEIFNRNVDLVLIGTVRERSRERIFSEVRYVEGF
jgi:hypothetical protein